jgi:IclR family acetate operon transcriptional repressor
MHKATTHRLLATLAALGYVERSPDGAAYQIGLRISRLRDVAHSRLDLRRAARPALETLCDATKLTVHLAIRSQDEVVVVDKLHPPTSIQMASFVGARNPLYCTALGKSILAALPTDELQAALDRVQLVRRATNTITSRGRLLVNLDKTRTAGYAVDDVENEEGIRCVGAAIFDHTGRVIGACSVTGALSQIPSRRVRELGALAKVAADRVSAALGLDQRSLKAPIVIKE